MTMMMMMNDDDLLNELTAELTIDHDGDNKDKGGGDELDEQLNDTAAIDQGGVTGRGGTNDYDTRYAETKVTLTVALDNMKSLVQICDLKSNLDDYFADNLRYSEK